MKALIDQFAHRIGGLAQSILSTCIQAAPCTLSHLGQTRIYGVKNLVQSIDGLTLKTPATLFSDVDPVLGVGEITVVGANQIFAL